MEDKTCPNCYHSLSNVTYKVKGVHTGIYCSNCKQWIRWVAPSEIPSSVRIVEDPKPKPLFDE